jgi:hypothetical protein
MIIKLAPAFRVKIEDRGPWRILCRAFSALGFAWGIPGPASPSQQAGRTIPTQAGIFRAFSACDRGRRADLIITCGDPGHSIRFVRSGQNDGMLLNIHFIIIHLSQIPLARHDGDVII